jgi:hypothetical protein
MPKSLEPGVLFGIVLDSDSGKPKAEQPTFMVSSLSMRDQTKLEAEMEESLKHESADAIFGATCDLLGKYVRGWRNMGDYKFGECDFRDLLSHGEARELLRKILANQHVEPDEKKG